MMILESKFTPSLVAGKRPLIIFLHGYRHNPQRIESLVKVTRNVLPTADVWSPLMGHSRLVCFHRLHDTVEALGNELNRLWSDDYDELIIIGHSTGSPIARALFLWGRETPWSDVLVNNGRIIMLGGMNRGWKISHYLSTWNAIVWSFGSFFGHFFSLFGKEMTMFDIRRGSEFLTRIRFAWLTRMQHHAVPLTIQLLGTIDDMVSPEDSLDLVTGANFRYLDVPKSGHVTVLDMDELTPEGRARAEVLRIALSDEANIANEEVRPWGLKSLSPEERERNTLIDRVVFVIHGIRDRGFWTDKIARHIWKQCSPTDRDRLERITSSYGYFGMGPFLLPWVRREKIEWLADQVLEAKALYPNARLSYVGHSNGTYLLTGAFNLYPDVEGFKFEHVVFAGSVVSKRYDWSRVAKRGQVKRVLNMVATKDWVVALFPQVFEYLPIQDLGSAGHNGFVSQSSLENYEFAKGGHSAGLAEEYWTDIADFILYGNANSSPDPRVPQFGLKGSLLRIFGAPVFVWGVLVSVFGLGIPLFVFEYSGLGFTFLYLLFLLFVLRKL